MSRLKEFPAEWSPLIEEIMWTYRPVLRYRWKQKLFAGGSKRSIQPLFPLAWLQYAADRSGKVSCWLLLTLRSGYILVTGMYSGEACSMAFSCLVCKRSPFAIL
ncbi:hypothetical protein ZWY2020_031927 [Hordeum vulgare]|nr:hypothetical protein ZWY2020_031927 [Hordeum vulgare]